ncbi:hypothetical protein K469DRAFT_104003 [Zopfia rhizophila CBS 207.26]|uniref:Uncharacterized protein n=1 Tax=Zopfia rhizophila CBS 207.26 TaxID=1314779 RepID=A0A6A6EA57_9PEZI|nr:hypothetical protein K469DRAFT_104003 [Zopfia rhizophila CBS 207.26]
MEVLYPWGNGTTCVSAGGTNVYETTNHQLIIRRENPEDDMGDWCVKNLNKLVEKCVEKSLFYGGYWAEGNKLINLTNLAWTDRFRPPPMDEVRNWNNVYGKHEDAVDAMKKGATLPGDFKPEELPHAA